LQFLLMASTSEPTHEFLSELKSWVERVGLGPWVAQILIKKKSKKNEEKWNLY
jgi:hypothetical protein